MKAKLVLISPDSAAKEFKLALPTKIGRGQEAKLKLVHPLVSRVHCEIYEQDDQLMVRDMASLNGTFVDDERVADEMALPSGCRLTVGSAHFYVLYGADYDRPLPKKAAAKPDAPTKQADATIPMSPSAKSAEPDEEDDPWSPAESNSNSPAEAHGDTRTLDFDFLSDDETPEPAPAPMAAAPAKPADAKPATPAKPADAPKPAAPAKPAAAKTSAPGRPPNPAELADEDELASSAKPFAAKGRPPAKTAPAAQAPAAPSDDSDEMVAGPAEESGGEGDDADLDDFLKSIM